MSARRRIRGSAAWLAMLVGLLLALPAAASAKTFTVDSTGDAGDANPGNGTCATAGMVCTLRAAVQEANANTTVDTVAFAQAVKGNTIQLGTPIFTSGINGDLTIGAGDCPDGTFSHKPCVEVRAPTGGGDFRALSIGGEKATIRGIAFTHSDGPGGAVQIGSGSGHKITNSWFGLKLDGTTLDANEVGLNVDNALGITIGGLTGGERNVFVGGTDGIRIHNSDSQARVRGNYLGVMPDGVTQAPLAFADNAIDIRTPADLNAAGSVIGASIDSAHRATAKCDGGCNVIANADEAGIDLDPVASPFGAQRTVVKGNFIGIAADGTTAVANEVGVNNGGADLTTIGGSTSAERNFITGGATGIRATDSDPDDLEIKRNYVGLNATGTVALAAPTGQGIDVISGFGGTVVSRNRLAGAGAVGIRSNAFQSRVIRNKIGLDKNGNDEPGPVTGVLVDALESKIGEPGAGNTIGNSGAAISILGGDGNRVQGNYIGVDPAGVAHPNSELGILIQNPGLDAADDNVIGGTSGATENVISNSGDDAIQLVDGTFASTGNQIKRNRGKDNGVVNTGDMFIDLGNNGPGNPGLNGGITAPVLADSDPGDTTRSHTEGTCSGHTVYIFRTSNADGDAPNRINAFVKMASCGITHVFSANFSKIPSGQSLTALNLDNVDGSSELATAVAPPGP